MHVLFSFKLMGQLTHKEIEDSIDITVIKGMVLHHKPSKNKAAAGATKPILEGTGGWSLILK